MADRDTLALRRTAAVLLTVSVVRFGWAHRPAAPLPPGEEILEELIDSSAALQADAERRSRPLASGERIDPNTADPAELDRLPGIGPALADRIVEERAREPFRTVRDLQRVRGIGPAGLRRHPERRVTS